jgi:hypothetical protein
MVVDENQSHRSAMTIIYERTVLSIAVGMERGAKRANSVTLVVSVV